MMRDLLPLRASASPRRPESAASASPRCLPSHSPRLPSHLAVAAASHSLCLSFSPAASNSSSLRPRSPSRPNHPYPFISTTGRTIHIHSSSPSAAARHQHRPPDTTTRAAPCTPHPFTPSSARFELARPATPPPVPAGIWCAGGLLLPTGELRARRRPR
jgi:hypothetical protein